MSWKDNLLPASFRGVPFYVESSDIGAGRRNIVHQFPFQDIPYVEDIGEDATDFALEAYVIQNIDNDFDYFPEKTNLYNALRQQGPGLLIHPYYGEVNVSVLGKFRVIESAVRNGGIARFTINFVFAGEPISPEESVDPESTIDEAVDQALADIKDDFDETFDSADAPDFSTDFAVSDINEGLKMIRNAIVSVQDSIDSSVSAAISDLAELQSNIESIIDSPEDISNLIIAGFNSFTSIVGLTGDTVDPSRVTSALNKSCTNACLAIKRFGEVLGIEDPSPYGGQVEDINITTATRAQQSANQTAIVNIFRSAALVIAAKIAIRTEYESFDEANTVLNDISGGINDELLKIGSEIEGESYGSYQVLFESDKAYSALESVRDVFVKLMIESGATLAKIVDYNVPPENISTLQLAYERYKDLDRADNIFERNKDKIEHPGFLPQGETIEILSA